MAIPQLLILDGSCRYTVDGSTMQLLFNWVNNRGSIGTLIDNYFWFWIKNVGIVYLLLIPAAIHLKKRSPARGFMLGALILYLVAECVVFQKNIYDNNKLFYAAFMVCLPAVGTLLADAIGWIRGMRAPFAKVVCAAAMGVLAVVCLLSGSLSIGREIVSDYVLFSAGMKRRQARISIRATARTRYSSRAISTTACRARWRGATSSAGSPTFLYYHGLNYSVQHADRREMLEHPAENAELFENYNVSYVYISNYERADFAVDEAWFAANGTLVFESGNVRIYAL